MMASTKRKELIAANLQAWRRIVRFAVPWTDAIAAAQGVHPTDLIAASYLYDAGPATAGWLAEKTGLTTGAMTTCIDRLERAGFAMREADASDRRKVMIKPGKLPQLSNELLALRAGTMKKAEGAFSHCSDAEIGRMTECMQKLALIFEQEANAFKKLHRKRLARRKDPMR
ncbi:MAG TPA: MarR family transcriptional regulator [Planctomycetaceae bacterium]|nr:MarR family transcriptional regulator [Planctomycetaceae bacterium]